MKLSLTARRARYLAFSALAFVAFEACSNSSESTATGSTEPSGIAITPPAGTLACDDSLVVSLALTNLHLLPPGVCGTTPQCGSVTVSLLETEDGAPLLTPVRAATTDVQLDLSSLVSPPTADAPTLSQVHFVEVQVFGDSLSPYPAPNGGALMDIQPLTLSPATGCAAGNAGAANAGGAAGMAGASNLGNAGASSGGAGGEGGSPNTGGMAGTSQAEGGAAGEHGGLAGASG